MAENFLKQSDIEHWGMKAASLRFFKEQGLFEGPVAFIDGWNSRDDIISVLKASWLSEEGLGMSIRFSSRANSFYQIHRWIIRHYDWVADYLEENKQKLNEGTFIIYRALIPALMGNILIQHDGSFHVEIIPGTWITSGSEPTDYVDIVHSTVVFNAHQRPRRVLAKLQEDQNGEVIMGKFVDRIDPPYSEQFVALLSRRLVEITSRMAALRFPSEYIYEFNVNEGDPEYRIHLREIKEIEKQELTSSHQRHEDIFEVSSLDALVRWDSKTPLYITMAVNKTNAKDFLTLIEALRDRGVKQLYIKYGVLTHPAILLREAGMKPITLRSEYKEYKFKF